MDSNEVKKKFFDVAPPKSAASSPPIVQPRKNQMISITEPEPAATDGPNTLLAPSDNIPHRELIIDVPTPKTESVTQPEPEVVSAEALTKNQPEVVADTEPEEPIAAKVDEQEQVAVDEPATEASAIDPLPETVAAESSQEPQPSEKELAEADKEIPASEGYAISDALPDKSVSEAKDAMQDPKIYDTNAYHVPIKETHHGHGSAKAAFAFGALFAAAVVACALYVMMRIGA